MNISDLAVALAFNSEARYGERSIIREKRLNEASKGNCWGAGDPDRVENVRTHQKN